MCFVFNWILGLNPMLNTTMHIYRQLYIPRLIDIKTQPEWIASLTLSQLVWILQIPTLLVSNNTMTKLGKSEKSNSKSNKQLDIVWNNEYYVSLE